MTQLRKRRPLSPKQAAACKKPVDDLLDPELFKAMSDPTRVLLLGCLVKCGRPCSVTEIAACCSVDISVVSRHLTMLARADILGATKSGRTVTYAVRSASLVSRLRALADAIEDCCPAATKTMEACCGPG